MTASQRAQAALLLQLEPDLGAGLDAQAWEEARAACRVALISLPPGPCDLASGRLNGEPVAGFVILSGMVCRELKLRGRHLIELLGPGDVLRPPPADDGSSLIPGHTITTVRETLALRLGPNFIHCAGRWPCLMTNLLDRIERQHQRLAAQELIVHQPSAKIRLLLILWHLADRWGRVTPDGTHLPLPLTPETLGQLIASKRPTVTLSLRELGENNQIKRLTDGTWLLTPSARDAVDRIAHTEDGGWSLGEALRVRGRSGELILDAQALDADARQILRPRNREARPTAG